MSASQDERHSNLMKLAQNGDHTSYELLLKEIYALLRQFIEHKIGRCGAWEDVIQDILISIHKARHTYDCQKPFAPWMYAIARYRMADHWRRVFRSIEDPVTDAVEMNAVAPETESAGTALTEKLSSAMDKLPEKHRLVIDLLKIQGYTIEEAARELKMSESAVKVTAHRAYKMIRKKFEEQMNGYN